ncbi:MAG: hypothetical protein JJ975_03880 [Bacteroidia bacterium]|nr:hypothetical protein [Bacteroidia bacterium]
MKYLSLLLLLFLSKFTSGQSNPRVYTTFENVAVFDDFSYITNRWEQKNSSAETFIISENTYTIQRVKDSYFSISLAKDVAGLSDFEIITSVELERNKSNKNASGGIVLKAQPSGNGALILEINAKRQYRFRIIKNGAMNVLFGDRNDGWMKSKNLRTKGINEIRVATKGNEYDVYFNNQFERSLIETSFKEGGVGFYANARSTLKARLFIIKINGELEDPTPKEDEIDEVEETTDDTYTELVRVFKAKIDRQQAELDSLSEELHICQANLSIDTASANKVKTLTREINVLKTDKERLETEISQIQKRLTYLESMKEDIESQTNGDLIIHLTELLSKEKDRNKKLIAEKKVLQKEVNELRGRN